MRGLALFVLSALILAGVPHAAEAMIKKYELHIPRQALDLALNEFSRVTGLQVARMSDQGPAVGDVGPLHGEYEAGAALDVLLKGSGLRYEFLNDRVVRIYASSTTGGRSNLYGPRDLAEATLLAQANQNQNSSTQAVAPAPLSPGNSSAELNEVVVTGHYEFLSADTSGTTNLPLPIEKVPQSISLVSGDFIKAADLKTLGEIAEYTPGAVNAGNQYGFGSDIMLRGFTPGRAVDGIDIQSGSTLAFYEPDYAIFDRLEVVKGPSSVVYGVASPGGVVNFVTKSATPQTTDYVFAQAGSWNSFRVEGQIAGALDSDGRVRGIGIVVRDQGDSFIDELNHTKTVLYGGIDVDLGNSVTAYLHGGYERFKRPAFDASLTEADGSPAPLPRSFFIGSSEIQYTTSVYHGEGNLTWHATDQLEFNVKGNFENANNQGDEDYAFGLGENGDFGFLVGKIDEWRVKNYGIGASSIYHFDALGLKNSFLSLGALYQYSDQLYVNEYAIGSANIFSGQAAITNAMNSLLVAGPLNPPSGNEIIAKTFTVSAQSVVQLLDPLSLLVGVSHSKPDLTGTTIQSSVSFAGNASIGGQTSYRAGLTYEFLPRTNAYISYSQSFNPQALFAVNNSVLPPLTGNQYEGGIKYRSTDGRLLLTGALFQIKEKNVAQYDQTAPDGISYYKAIGEVSHKGVELQGLGQITPEWQVNIGYSYLDPKVIQDPNPLTVGKTQLWLPKNTASLYSTYTLQNGSLRGLSFGGGVRYVSAQQTSYDGSTRDLPGYAIVDATLGYTVDKWRVQLNAHNILDRQYLVNNWQTYFYGNVIGDPTNFTVSIRRQF